MADTRTQPLCIYCGTARPASTGTCPTCGRAWIDSLIAEPQRRADSEHSLAPSELQPYPSIEHENLPLTPMPEPQRRTGLIVAAAAVLVAVGALIVVANLNGAGDEVAASTTTVAASTTTTPSDATSEPPEATTTTAIVESSTTTEAATTTTTTEAPAPAIDAIGDPIPLSEIGLGAFALGPFDFEVAAAEPLGRLAATFGQPDAVAAADAAWGLCEDDTGRVIQWGPLSVITVVVDGQELLGGYRLIGSDDTSDHPAASLTTLSGIALGDTVTRLREVYANSTIDYPMTVEGATVYRLLRSSDDAVLLWGPVTGDETIAGIYSPRACDGGP